MKWICNRHAHCCWLLLQFNLLTHYYSLEIELLEDGRLSNAVESDYLQLYTASSSMGENIGLGVFANTDIPADTILCEYRGAFF